MSPFVVPLKYNDCGDGFECARLKVPMDYNSTGGKGRKFSLAIVRIPAKVPVSGPRYGGAVLINPGWFTRVPLSLKSL